MTFKALILFFICGGAVQAQSETYIEDFLTTFHQDTEVAMDQLPDEIVDGQIVKRGSIQYSQEKQITRDEIIDAQSHHKSLWKSLSPEDPAWNSDEVLNLVYRQNIIRNLGEAQRSGLLSGSTQFNTWSDSYWPIYKGLIAIRYADRQFPNSKIWINNYQYYQSRPSFSYLGGREDELSPAEKYDLLVGDGNWSLTKHMWGRGLEKQNNSGYVSRWQGICHGWAGAAHFNVPIPKRSVRLNSVNGTPITFYESDIKAFNSLLWARSNPRTRFVGRKCEISQPRRDKNGRIIEPSCLDVDPSTWHLAVINHIGADKYSFVMDSTYDMQVWNFAISKYKYIYFNPQTFRPTVDLGQAMIAKERFKVDKFTSYRHPDTRYIVGVQMDVSYPAPMNPRMGSHSSTPKLKVIRYVYDLELDANRNVIGGEWYSNAHPDFIWTFEKGSWARSSGDALIGDVEEWSGSMIPERWAEVARVNSKNGRVLEKIVRKLLIESGSEGSFGNPDIGLTVSGSDAFEGSGE